MKKSLLAIALFCVTFISSMAATIDDVCGFYIESSKGKQAQWALSDTYNDVKITNLVIVSKNSKGNLEFYGFFKSPNAVKGAFDEATQTILFTAQKFGGSDDYNFCKAASDTATIDDKGVITLNNWTMSYGTHLYCKEMVSTFTPVKADDVLEGTISAPGYFEGSATLTRIGSRYLLKEGTKMGYTHYISANTKGVITFPWATVMYSDDEYCYIYNTLEDEDLLMVSNANENGKLTNDGTKITIITPFKYYIDQSDESSITNPKDPDAQGTYTATFGLSTGVEKVSALSSQAAIYNIQGQRIAQPQHGINIINGRKVVK